MPFEWIEHAPDAGSDLPRAELHAWPFRSLPRKGFVIFIVASVAIVMLPLSALIGTAALWGVLPFLILVIGGVWIALERSYRDGAVLEELRLWEDRVTLHHHDPRHGSVEWQANPHWIRPELHRDHRIENYLTLHGGPRVVELGAFLTPQERQHLYAKLTQQLDDLRHQRS